MDISIQSYKYNKINLKEDGKTQVVDTHRQYIGYSIQINEIYYIEDKKEIIRALIKDLQNLTQNLTQKLGKEEQESLKQILENKMDINIQPFKYNKTILKEDGKTQIVDTSRQYIGYIIQINEIYHIEDKKETIRTLIKDLQNLIENLKQKLEKKEQQSLKQKLEKENHEDFVK